MSKKITLFVISLSVIFAFGFSRNGEQGGTVTLKYNQEAGKTVNYTMTASTNDEVDVMGQVMGSSSTTDAEVAYKIASVSEGKIHHELSFTSLEYENVSDMGSTNPDTEAQLNNPLKIITGMRCEGMDITNMSDMPQLSEEEPMPVALSFLGFLFELPEKAVNVNGKWSSSTTVNFDFASGDMSSETSADYTFVGTETRNGFECAKITGKGVTKMTGAMFIQGMDTEYEGEDNYEVTIYFAIKEGIMVESVTKNNMEMTVDVAAAGMSVVVSSTGETKYSIKK